MLIRTILTITCLTHSLCQAEPYGAIKSVGLIAAKDPIVYTVRSYSTGGSLVPLVRMVEDSENLQRTTDFTNLMKSNSFNHGAALTSSIADRLRSEGYEVHILDKVTYLEWDPTAVDYEQQELKEDIGLHVRFNSVGFYSGYGNEKFTPKVNVDATSFTKGAADYPYQTTIYYGAGAKRGKEWSITSPDSESINNADYLMSNPNVANNIFKGAINKIADLIVLQFKASTPPK